MARWSRGVAAAFLLGAGMFAVRGFERPVIVVIQSYGDNIPWTRGTNAGLRKVLESAKDVHVRWLYLDANDPTRQQYTHSRIEDAKTLIGSERPRAIIAMDDTAQTQVAAPLLGRHPGWTIFGGIDGATGELQDSALATVAGISERTPWPAVQALLAEFASQRGIARPRVALINDTSSAADEEAAGFQAHPWQGMRVAGLWRCKDHDQWRAALRAMQDTVDLVVVGDYRTMPLPAGMERGRGRQEIARMTLAALPVPVAALSGYAVDDGIPVGILPSPLEQGEEAARLALAAVRGGATPYRHRESREVIIHADEAALKARTLELPELYASFARQVSPLFRPTKE